MFETRFGKLALVLGLILISSSVLSIIASADDSYEDNDYSYDAAIIYSGSYDLYCNDDDWFKIYLDYGDSIDVSISFDSYDADLDLRLYDTYVDSIDSSTGTGDYEEVSAYSVSDSGYYYILVESYDGGSAYYTMDVSVTSSSSSSYDDSYEDNDYSYDAAIIYSGSYDLYCNDDDWFKIYLDYGDSIDVSISFDSYDADLDLRLYDTYVDSIDSSTGTGDYEEVSAYSVSDSGYYYIKVYSADGGSASYTMYVSIDQTSGGYSSASESYLPSKWNPGEGWGYRWDIDMSDIAQAMEDYPYSSDVSVSASGSGRILSVLYIEYEGQDSDGYRFMYEGRTYSQDASLTMHMSSTSSYSGDYYSTNMNMNMYINKADTNFDGHFWLNGYESNGMKYYGITKQTLDNLHLIMDFSADIEGTSYSSYSGTESYNMHMSMNYDITVSDFEIYYSPAIPYLPYDSGSSVDISTDDIEVNYDGYVEGSYSYSITGTGSGVNDSSDSGHIDTTLRDSESTYSGADLNYDSSTGIAEKPMPITGANSLITPIPSSTSNNGGVMVNSYAPISKNKGRLSGDFYEKMTPSSSFGSVPMSSSYSPESPERDWSSSASKDDVEGIKNSDNPLNQGFPLWAIILLILVIGVSAVLIGVILYRRKKRPPAPVPPLGGGMYAGETYPTYGPYQQYPPDYPPEPGYSQEYYNPPPPPTDYYDEDSVY